MIEPIPECVSDAKQGKGFLGHTIRGGRASGAKAAVGPTHDRRSGLLGIPCAAHHDQSACFEQVTMVTVRPCLAHWPAGVTSFSRMVSQQRVVVVGSAMHLDPSSKCAGGSLFWELQQRLAIIAAWGASSRLKCGGGTKVISRSWVYGQARYQTDNISLVTRVGFSQMIRALFAVYGSILCVAVREDLDEESSPPKRQPQVSSPPGAIRSPIPWMSKCFPRRNSWEGGRAIRSKAIKSTTLQPCNSEPSKPSLRSFACREN